MGRKRKRKGGSFPVNKRLPDGTLVHEFASLFDVTKEDGLCYRSLVHAIANELEIKGHIYSCPAIPVVSKKEQAPAKERGRPVYKYDHAGQKVKEYKNVNEAAVAEGVKPQRLRNLIFYQHAKNGFTFKLGYKPPKKLCPPVEEIEVQSGRRPWEGKNGMFSITGWATLTIPV